MKSLKCTFAAIFVIALIIAHTAVAQARTVKMVFWYPGEAGSTVEGQPVLDAFFDYVSKKIAPDKMEGRYFNGVSDGLQYIMKEKPAVGIVSFAAWSQNSTKLGGAKILLATLPMPSGQPTERYTLVGTATDIKAGTNVMSSEPLSEAFVRNALFKKIPAGLKFTQTPQLFANLKKIADGSLNAAAILTPNEAQTLQKISAAWVKSLKEIALSEPVPTARLIVFDQGWNGSEKFKQALLQIGSDSSAKDFMDEMRLAGFAEIK